MPARLLKEWFVKRRQEAFSGVYSYCAIFPPGFTAEKGIVGRVGHERGKGGKAGHVILFAVKSIGQGGR